MEFLNAGRGQAARAGGKDVYKYVKHETNLAKHVCFDIFNARLHGDKAALGIDWPTVFLSGAECARFTSLLPNRGSRRCC